jgi:two-component sensor histidine kinase
MTDIPDCRDLFEALAQPAFIVSTDGRIESANGAAAQLLGANIAGQSVTALDPERPQVMARFLSQCSGSKRPLAGEVRLSAADGTIYGLRCLGRLLRPATPSGPALIFIDCVEAQERFSILSEQLRDLNEEVCKRRHVEDILQESLRERDVLLRELQHRVRNNLQLVSGMLSSARREAASAAAKTALQDASARIAAVGVVQQIFYNLEPGDCVSADAVVRELCASLASGPLANRPLKLRLDPIHISNEFASPIALVLNELVMNAVTHGCDTTEPLEIVIELKQVDDEIVLIVQDRGPGFEMRETGKRASGLGLVRGLLRQIGGKLEISRDNGARCVVRLRDTVRSEPAHGFVRN